jgi:molybdopterin molybdotransferase
MTVADADSIIGQFALPLPAETVALADAPGRVLRQPVFADRDFPPFDRVAMDGIAIRFADYQAGTRSFRVVGMQRAGQPQQALTESGACLEVMTGAMLPTGTDAVVRYEDIKIQDGVAVVQQTDVRPGQHIHHQATDRQAGAELLPAGTRLGPTELAVAASVGQTMLTVSRLPRVALVSTGDELVDVGQSPRPWQIRRSNDWLLQTALADWGIRASHHHLPDDPDALQIGLQTLLDQHDVLFLSGGVSAGKADFVPTVLARLGATQQFHRVQQKPGKPLWFGTFRAGEQDMKVVFALPGNPVSTTLCYYRYGLPWLRASLGLPPAPVRYAQLTEPITFRPALTYFLPVVLVSSPDGRLLAHPRPGSGSADYANLLDTDGFLELPADRSDFLAGDVFPVWVYRV